jgi:transcription elongation factor GreA
MITPESEFHFEYLTPEGSEELKKELENLKTDRRKEIAETLERARELGDLAENSEYQRAKEEQAMVESRISELEDILSRAVIIPSAESAANVRIGSTVSVQKEDGGKIEKYHIVGSKEAEPSNGKISNESPLGRALLGRKKSEKVSILTPNGEMGYTIIDVG